MTSQTPVANEFDFIKQRLAEIEAEKRKMLEQTPEPLIDVDVDVDDDDDDGLLRIKLPAIFVDADFDADHLYVLEYVTQFNT